MAETTPTKARATQTQSTRDRHLERLRKKYPDRQFEDDESLFGQITEDYDQYEQENTAMKDREKALSDMFRANPQAAFFLNDMREGKDPVMSLIRRLGMEVKDVLDDPAMQGKIEEAHKEYMERAAKSKALDEEYFRNIETTLSKTLPEYQQQSGATDEEIDKICAAWLQIVKDGVIGKLTPETITLISNALNHDTDVESAHEEGNVAGRNAKISEKLRQSKKGDGIQPLGGRNGTPAPASPKGSSLFDIASEAM